VLKVSMGYHDNRQNLSSNYPTISRSQKLSSAFQAATTGTSVCVVFNADCRLYHSWRGRHEAIIRSGPLRLYQWFRNTHRPTSVPRTSLVCKRFHGGVLVAEVVHKKLPPFKVLDRFGIAVVYSRLVWLPELHRFLHFNAG